MPYFIRRKGVFMEFTKVTMNLTDTDVKNTAKLTKRLNSRSKAATISKALDITKTITEVLAKGGKIMIHNPDGTVEKLTIVGI